MSTKLIVALDVDTLSEAKSIVDELQGHVEVFKVGSILYSRHGKDIIKYIQSKGSEVFLDLKFFDIPNTVRGVSRAAAEMGVNMFTIHLLGGQEMIKGALDGVNEALDKKELFHSPLVLGVTILTSMNDAIIKNDLSINKKVSEMVPFLAGKGYEMGMRGFVCSPFEIEILKEKYPDAKLVTPGIRLAGEAKGDQKRVMTPGDARRLGADYIVMGRSVYGAPDILATVEEINTELGN